MAGFKPGAWARRPSRVGVGAALLAAVAVAGVAAGCGADPAPGLIQAVGAENQYANVIAQIGGRYVQVTAVVSNPNTDPHSFQASAQVARTLSSAELVVQNGLGYDTFMGEIEAAGHRRAAAAGSARQHAQPPPLV
jgi:zinc/manganese transport system substrate-binding protein